MASELTVVGLKRRIVRGEAVVEIKKRLGEDVGVEMDLLKSWRTYLPGGRNHHKLAQNKCWRYGYGLRAQKITCSNGHRASRKCLQENKDCKDYIPTDEVIKHSGEG